MIDMKQIGEKIRLLREDAGLTQERLSELAEISNRALQRVEAGGNAEIQTILKISAALKTEPWELLLPAEQVAKLAEPQAPYDIPTPDELADVLKAYGRAAPDTRAEVRKKLGLAPGPDFEKLRTRARNILQTQEKTPPKASEDD